MKRVSTAKTLITAVILAAVSLVLLTGCLPGDGTDLPDKPANFLMGIWHGWLAPISLILSLFTEGIRIYETYNTGWWYDFGYYIAIISGFGGLSLIRKKKSE